MDDLFPRGISAVVDSWPLMAPTPMLLIMIVYLLTVTQLGPKFMKNRVPMNLTGFTRIYNVTQVICCGLFIFKGFDSCFSFKTTLQCPDNITEPDALAFYQRVQWWFILLRLSELTETIAFVLRKKQNQVSVLHVYHHTITPWIVWVFLKYSNCKYFDI